MELNDNERIDDLGYKNLKIIQNKKEFCFGIDSVLLANFAKHIKKNSKVIDLGTGTGIITILLATRCEVNKIIGVEIQKQMAEMATRSIKLNNLQDKIEILNEDIKYLDNIFQNGEFDVVITNPPYRKDNTGLQNINEGNSIARYEVKCNLDDILSVSSKLLKDGGEFYMIHKLERIIDIAETMRKYQIEPKELQLIFTNKDAKPNLILIKGIKKAKQFLKINKSIYIYEEKGKYSNDILRIYNDN